jgi:hypothetical protein
MVSVNVFCQCKHLLNELWVIYFYFSFKMFCLDCGQPPSYGDGSSFTYTNILLDGVATYTCGTGYTTKGTNFITCGGAALWSAKLFTCNGRYHYYSHRSASQFIWVCGWVLWVLIYFPLVGKKSSINIFLLLKNMEKKECSMDAYGTRQCAYRRANGVLSA